MVVTEKLKKVKVSEETRRKIIEKGGNISCETTEKEWTTYCLRITRSLLKKLDDALEIREGISRNGWILDAVREKLKRDEANE